MNRVFCLIVAVSEFLVTAQKHGQYSYNTELYRRHRPRNVIQPPALLNEATAPAAVPAPAPLPVSVPLVSPAFADATPSSQEDFTIPNLIGNYWQFIKEGIILESQHESTAALIQEMVEANPCVDSLDGYIEFLERRVKIIQEYSPDFVESTLKVLSLRGEKELGVVMKTGADILTKMDSVMSDIIPSFACIAGADTGIEQLRTLSLNLYRQSQAVDIPGISNKDVRESLYMAARFVEAASNMVDHLSKNLARKNCYTSNDNFGDFIDILAATISDLAEGAGALEYFEGAKELRQYSKFISSVKDSIGDLPDFKTQGDCRPGAISRNAAVLKKIADIVTDVDMETLFIETGVFFRLDLLP